MKKLKLKLKIDDLAVSTFNANDVPGGIPGTVKGNAHLPPVDSQGCGTFGASCFYTDCPDAFASCEYTCDCVSPSGMLCPTFKRC